jgi:hypothetical protein
MKPRGHSGEPSLVAHNCQQGSPAVVQRQPADDIEREPLCKRASALDVRNPTVMTSTRGKTRVCGRCSAPDPDGYDKQTHNQATGQRAATGRERALRTR